jgi:hypothetical protein
MLRIKACSDPQRWYADLVGKNVPALGYDPISGWKSKEPAGYTNFILPQDAERIAVFVPEYLLGRWPYITRKTLEAQAVTKVAATLPPKNCAASCNAMGICQALEDCEHEERINAELGRKGVKPPAPKPPPPRAVTGRCEKLVFGRLPEIEPGIVATEERICTSSGQSRTHSMAETMANIAVGFAVSMAIQAVVLPAFGHHITLAQNFWITCIFTVASVVRGYALRRIFNRLHSQGG